MMIFDALSNGEDPIAWFGPGQLTLSPVSGHFGVKKHGAKHSLPVSDRGPICQKGGPPKCVPETPLANVFICQIFTKSIIGNTNCDYFWCSFEWWQPHCLIPTGSLDTRANFGSFLGQKLCFLKNRHANLSNGLNITCGGSRTCFRSHTSVLVKFHDLQKITIFWCFFASMS